MNALHPLGQLIQSVEDSRGWSLRAIGRRTEKAPTSLTHTYIGRLKTKPITSVTIEAIQALAVGLDVPERVVGIAALESMGVHDVDPSEADLAATIARDASLTERDRRVLLAAVREMQRGQDDQQDGERVAPAAGGSGVAGDALGDGVTSDEPPERPWERDDFDLAAKRGENRGRAARERQDAEGEAGGA